MRINTILPGYISSHGGSTYVCHHLLEAMNDSGIDVSLFTLIEETLVHPVEKRYLPARDFDVSISVSNNNLARQKMGWTPKISLREGIKITAEWMMKEVDAHRK